MFAFDTRILKSAAVLLILLLTLSPGFAQRNFDEVEIRTEQVSDNIYVLFGAGGNIGLAGRRRCRLPY